MKFSIILKTFNRRELIPNALKSILRQSYKNFEIILVDDFSQDDTQIYVKKKFNDKRIKYFYLKKNIGHVKASEYGLNAATGDIICFLDDDDEWDRTFLQKHYSEYQKDPEVSCVYNDTVTIINKKKILSNHSMIEGYCYQMALKQLYISSQIAISFKKKTWECLKKLDGNIENEDDDLCLRLAKKYKFKKINEPLSFAIHRQESPGVSKDNIAHAENFEKIFDKYKDDILKYCNNEDISNLYFKLSIKFFYAKKFKIAAKYNEFAFKKKYPTTLKKLIYYLIFKIINLIAKTS
jgi:glycosyltransferase involved in cell wall biosynthesis